MWDHSPSQGDQKQKTSGLLPVFLDDQLAGRHNIKVVSFDGALLDDLGASRCHRTVSHLGPFVLASVHGISVLNEA